MQVEIISKKECAEVRRVVWVHYKKNGRHDLPWRKTKDPYKILVSEVMLQQTQVARVIPKYKDFLTQFPTVQVLASASLAEVLSAWQGLGYNRRAKMLHSAGRCVVQEYGGRMPKTYTALRTLSGVGDYTARAVCVFAYNMPLGLVETNVRTVFFHHFFNTQEQVADSAVLACSEACADKKNPREWFWALMDYGAWLKGQGVRVNKKSAHYTKQKKFQGSTRELRGALVRALTKKKSATMRVLLQETKRTQEEVRVQLLALEREGLVVQKGRSFLLA